MGPEAVNLLVHEWHVHLIDVEKRPAVFVGFANLNAGAGTRVAYCLVSIFSIASSECCWSAHDTPESVKGEASDSAERFARLGETDGGNKAIH